MFGAVVAYLFEHLLGITQQKNTAGYTSLLIEPKATSKFGRMSGSLKTPSGIVSVSYINDSIRTKFEIHIPKNTKATFLYSGQEFELVQGENAFEIN